MTLELPPCNARNKRPLAYKAWRLPRDTAMLVHQWCKIRLAPAAKPAPLKACRLYFWGTRLLLPVSKGRAWPTLTRRLCLLRVASGARAHALNKAHTSKASAADALSSTAEAATAMISFRVQERGSHAARRQIEKAFHTTESKRCHVAHLREALAFGAPCVRQRCHANWCQATTALRRASAQWMSTSNACNLLRKCCTASSAPSVAARARSSSQPLVCRACMLFGGSARSR
mmetsp:Transcript_118225/g.294983  ORF Transcript_118225/g.294983 Transcript_118225/m.294983 type:complete len:231 (-) Transcript_118225:395-1087(-)